VTFYKFISSYTVLYIY